jgi:hypothetical protein
MYGDFTLQSINLLGLLNELRASTTRASMVGARIANLVVMLLFWARCQDFILRRRFNISLTLRFFLLYRLNSWCYLCQETNRFSWGRRRPHGLHHISCQSGDSCHHQCCPSRQVHPALYSAVMDASSKFSSEAKMVPLSHPFDKGPMAIGLSIWPRTTGSYSLGASWESTTTCSAPLCWGGGGACMMKTTMMFGVHFEVARAWWPMISGLVCYVRYYILTPHMMLKNLRWCGW